jgi:Ni,Fe-hydrogenase I small subunit
MHRLHRGVSPLIQPFIDDLLLNKISPEYHETIMAPQVAATKSLRTRSASAGKFFCVVEGSIPLPIAAATA